MTEQEPELSPEKAEILYGEIIDLRRSAWDKDEKYIEFIINEKRHRAYVQKVGYKRTLDAKLKVWKDCKGDKEMYNLLARYALTKERVWKIDNQVLQKNDEIDELTWDSIDEDVVEYIVTYLYGIATLENPTNEEFLKNLAGEFLMDEEKLKIILNSAESRKNKEQPLEIPRITN